MFQHITVQLHCSIMMDCVRVVGNFFKSMQTNNFLQFYKQNSEAQSYENILEFIAIILSAIGRVHKFQSKCLFLKITFFF